MKENGYIVSAPNAEITNRFTTNNLLTEENIHEQVLQKNVDTDKKEFFIEQDNIEFDGNEESKQSKKSSAEVKKSKRINKTIHQSNDIISIVDESSVIKNKHKAKQQETKVVDIKHELKNVVQLDQSQSVMSVLNFHPDDIIANKITVKSRKAGGSNNTVVKTHNGFDSIAKSLQYINDLHRLKNKRQLSEFQIMKISREMKNIFHRHHLSNPNSKFAGLGESQIRKLENMKGDEFIKEISHFMEPRDIISMFSLEQIDQVLDQNQ